MGSVKANDTASVKVDDTKVPTTTLNGEGTSKDKCNGITYSKIEKSRISSESMNTVRIQIR